MAAFEQTELSAELPVLADMRRLDCLIADGRRSAARLCAVDPNETIATGRFGAGKCTKLIPISLGSWRDLGGFSVITGNR
jgi:hypothetical protein